MSRECHCCKLFSQQKYDEEVHETCIALVVESNITMLKTSPGKNGSCKSCITPPLLAGLLLALLLTFLASNQDAEGPVQRFLSRKRILIMPTPYNVSSEDVKAEINEAIKSRLRDNLGHQRHGAEKFRSIEKERDRQQALGPRPVTQNTTSQLPTSQLPTSQLPTSQLIATSNTGLNSTTFVDKRLGKGPLAPFNKMKGSFDMHFIHIPKCGGTSMTTILRDVACSIDPTRNRDCCINPGANII